jgi:hypothetical protein
MLEPVKVSCDEYRHENSVDKVLKFWMHHLLCSLSWNLCPWNRLPLWQRIGTGQGTTPKTPLVAALRSGSGEHLVARAYRSFHRHGFRARG